MLYVNGQPVKPESIEQEMERMRPEYDRTFAEMNEEERESQLRDWSRENIIERELLRQAAHDADALVADREARKHFDDLVEKNGGRDEFFKNVEGGEKREPEIIADIKAGMQVDRFVRKITELPEQPSDDETKNFYDQHAEEYVQPEMVHACHIVKHVENGIASRELQQEMENVLLQLRGGADFAELCYQHSDCPQNGGDLGYFARGEMVEEFEAMVFSLPAGGISNVFQTRFGLHIAKVLDRKESQPIPFEAVKDQARERLVEHLKHDKLLAFIDEEKEKATIEERDEPA